MKNYTITVNGSVYDVTVEEKAAGAAPAAAPAAAPIAVPKAAPAPKAAAGAGSIEVKAGAAGKVFKIEANVGQNVEIIEQSAGSICRVLGMQHNIRIDINQKHAESNRYQQQRLKLVPDSQIQEKASHADHDQVASRQIQKRRLMHEVL